MSTGKKTSAMRKVRTTQLMEGGHEDKHETEVRPGHLYFVATPLGNLRDITLRAMDILTHVDVICAEDTRHTIKLLRHLGLPHKEIISHHENNWIEAVPKIVSLAKSGSSCAVVSDAGTPGISDPGSQLAAACAREGIPLHPIPGPSAVVAALSVCGYTSTEFTFLGFLAVKGKERKEKLNKIKTISEVVVFFEVLFTF